MDAIKANLRPYADLLKSARFTEFVLIFCGISCILKICSLFPTMWPLPGMKKRKYSLPKCTIIGHRGSCSEGVPENTICSFTDALNSGCDMIELDVWLTKDKKLVVHHDEDFTRMTASTCITKINDMLYKDIKNIDLVPGIYQRDRIEEVCDNIIKEDKIKHLINDFTKDKLWKKVPLFEEILNIIPDHIGLIIEVKDPQPEMVELLHKIIKSRSQARQQNLFWF